MKILRSPAAKKRLSCTSLVGVTVIVCMTALLNFAATAQAQTAGKKPNILVIMGDDVGWFNIGAYNQDIMSGKTPNLDRLAAEGMRLTGYYAEASCTPLLGAEPFCVSAPLPQLSPSVAGFCGQAHRTLSISPTSEFDVELVDFDLL